LAFSRAHTSHLLTISVLFVFEVENSEPHNWQRRHSNVVHLVNNFFVKWLPRENRLESKHKLYDDVEDVLVEAVVD
jgi:hypothetical protein